VCDSVHLEQLNTLKLLLPFDDEASESLSRSPLAARLTHLDITVERDGAVALARCPAFGRIAELTLSCLSVPNDVFGELAASETVKGLSWLSLVGTDDSTDRSPALSPIRARAACERSVSSLDRIGPYRPQPRESSTFARLARLTLSGPAFGRRVWQPWRTRPFSRLCAIWTLPDAA